MENLTGTYPIIIDGATVGSLNVTKDGLYTVFDAACLDNGKIIRLSVYGDNWEYYLGVMIPRSDALRLRRRVSRSELTDILSDITHAAPQGQLPAVAVQPEEPAPEDAGDDSNHEAQEEFAAYETEAHDAEAENENPDSDILWKRAPNGNLIAVHEGRRLMAVRSSVPGLPLSRAKDIRVIENVEYLIFEIK